MPDPILDAALDYAAAGFPVLPVRLKRNGDKAPVFKGWQGLASADPDIIKGWFEGQYKGCGIGIPTGSKTGLYPIDVDVKTTDGFKAFRKLGLTGLDRVPTVMTPSNGNHFHYRIPPGLILKNTQSVLGAGIDTRGDGGFIIVPPTRLDLKRPAYQWQNGLTLKDAPTLPGEIVKLLTRPTDKAHKSLAAFADSLRTAKPGTRHSVILQSTFELAKLVEHKKLGRGEVLDALTDAARQLGHDRFEVEEAFEGALAKLRSTSGGAKAPPTAASIGIAELEPWPDAVDLGVVLNETTAAIRRFVWINEQQAIVAALWSAATHCPDVAFHSPRLNIYSPIKRCGKSTLRRVIAGLVDKPVLGENASPAVVYHLADTLRPCFLFDEVQHLLHHRSPDRAALTSLICASFEMTGATWRMSGEGAAMTPRLFKVFSPMLLAGIGRLGGSIGDRSIPMTLKRRLKNETVQIFDHDHDSPALAELARQFKRWSLDNADDVKAVQLSSAAFAAAWDDRQRDCARPLLKIAAHIGGAWPEAVRNALAAVWSAATASDGDGEDISLLVLADIRELFEADYRRDLWDATLDPKSKNHIGSERLVERLVEDPLKPWASHYGGRPLTQHGLARLLSLYGITPDRVGTSRVRGYFWRQFRDPWDRYLP